MEATYREMQDKPGFKEVWTGDPDEHRWYTIESVVFEDPDGNYWMGEYAYEHGDGNGSSDEINEYPQEWQKVVQTLKTVIDWKAVRENEAS